MDESGADCPARSGTRTFGSVNPPERASGRASIAAAVGLAGVLFVVGAVVTRNNGGPGSWQPSAAEIQKAVATAQAAAREEAPPTARGHASPTGWPAYVTSARLIGTNRQDALDAMGTPGAAAGNPPVILVEIGGTFGRAPFGPSNAARASVRAAYIQLALDPHSGQAYDGGLVGYEMDLEWYSTPITIYPGPASG